jgi:hypothetical protein
MKTTPYARKYIQFKNKVMSEVISRDGLIYKPDKDYYVVGARNAWDVVPIGLFGSKDDAHRCFPLSKSNIIRKATRLEINTFFNIKVK